MTIATITISFVPHQVALTSFLPLERVRPIAWLRGRLRAGVPVGHGTNPPWQASGGSGTPG
jgi:hypothetical protein